jgi:hypothetical protein
VTFLLIVRTGGGVWIVPRPQDSFIKEAFLAPPNLLALGVGAVLAAVTLSPLPLLIAAGAECLYLGTVPSLPGFKRRVRGFREKARREEEQRTLEEVLGDLSPSQRESYFALKDLREKLGQNYRRLPGGGTLVETSAASIDGLLTSFVRLLGSLNDYRRYLNQTDRKALERDLSELRVEVGGGEAGSDAVREVKKRRIEILEKRLERFDKAGESREIISHQLASIEDFLRLLHEQSITLRDPAVVGRQLEQVSLEVQATDETVREMEKLTAFTEELHPILPPERERAR